MDLDLDLDFKMYAFYEPGMASIACNQESGAEEKIGYRSIG
jgi:hypothetical protein